MKRNKKTLAKALGVGLGAAAISAAMLTGCDWFNPFQQDVEAVYGPPPDFQERPYDPSKDEPEDVYGPPSYFGDYDPEQDIPAPVYGPPPEDYDPGDDPCECVYGPPEDLGIDEPNF